MWDESGWWSSVAQGPGVDPHLVGETTSGGETTPPPLVWGGALQRGGGLLYTRKGVAARGPESRAPNWILPQTALHLRDGHSAPLGCSRQGSPVPIPLVTPGQGDAGPVQREPSALTHSHIHRHSHSHRLNPRIEDCIFLPVAQRVQETGRSEEGQFGREMSGRGRWEMP